VQPIRSAISAALHPCATRFAISEKTCGVKILAIFFPLLDCPRPPWTKGQFLGHGPRVPTSKPRTNLRQVPWPPFFGFLGPIKLVAKAYLEVRKEQKKWQTKPGATPTSCVLPRQMAETKQTACRRGRASLSESVSGPNSFILGDQPIGIARNAHASAIGALGAAVAQSAI
jgi:hypothetical protein